MSESSEVNIIYIAVFAAAVPGPASSEHQGDAVSRQDPGEAREVGVTIRRLLKYSLVELPLQKHQSIRGETASRVRRSNPGVLPTSLGKLLLEKTLRGQDR